MTSLEEARQIVQENLDEMSRRSGLDLVSAEELTRDEGWCWVIGYNTRAFLETRSMSHALVGNGPFVVEKATGRVHQLVSGRPVEVQLEELRPS